MILLKDFPPVKALLCAVLLCLAAMLPAQTFPRGAVLDPVLYDSLPQKAVQVSRAYESLPRAASLKQYAPAPGDQGSYGTCTALVKRLRRPDHSGIGRPEPPGQAGEYRRGVLPEFRVQEYVYL